MSNFTPLTALIGGALLGFAALMFLLLNGRIAGISSIVSGAIKPLKTSPQWRWSFLAGLIIAPLIAAPFGHHLPTSIDLSWSSILIGGFLVGFGSYLGSGCTSGHGICGVGRLSSRSITATIIFMLTAIITVFITQQLG
jgi:hypothetical protein